MVSILQAVPSKLNSKTIAIPLKTGLSEELKSFLTKISSKSGKQIIPKSIKGEYEEYLKLQRFSSFLKFSVRPTGSPDGHAVLPPFLPQVIQDVHFESYKREFQEYLEGLNFAFNDNSTFSLKFQSELKKFHIISLRLPTGKVSHANYVIDAFLNEGDEIIYQDVPSDESIDSRVSIPGSLYAYAYSVITLRARASEISSAVESSKETAAHESVEEPP
ncbi:uncharacterized protein J8A68_005013 [[Candida] subhashii]|uniref:Uncharacterized protein n=1 Tax=[Candida] subhashii TaxID=561895 RepID=A0A8J5QNL2_9ASCO|nr:uncharacterized protein J8A68_005013 [[Candida] subhashii]KAG7661435.1 hypothetical protein J8A68_005013 [[Candida] subhashii]